MSETIAHIDASGACQDILWIARIERADLLCNMGIITKGEYDRYMQELAVEMGFEFDTPKIRGCRP